MTQAPATPELVERLEPDATPAFSGDGPHTESPAPDSCADDTCPDHDPKGFVGEPRWRCFHCEFATSDEDEALQHFGPHPIFDPACKMTDAGQRREYIALDAAYSQVCKANKEAAAALEAQQARIAELEAEREDFRRMYRHWAMIADQRLGASNRSLHRAREAQARAEKAEASLVEAMGALRVARDFAELEIENRGYAGGEMTDYQDEAQKVFDDCDAIIRRASDVPPAALLQATGGENGR